MNFADGEKMHNEQWDNEKWLYANGKYYENQTNGIAFFSTICVCVLLLCRAISSVFGCVLLALLIAFLLLLLSLLLFELYNAWLHQAILGCPDDVMHCSVV